MKYNKNVKRDKYNNLFSSPKLQKPHAINQFIVSHQLRENQITNYATNDKRISGATPMEAPCSQKSWTKHFQNLQKSCIIRISNISSNIPILEGNNPSNIIDQAMKQSFVSRFQHINTFFHNLSQFLII